MKRAVAHEHTPVSDVETGVEVFAVSPPKPDQLGKATIWNGDVETMLDAWKGAEPVFDLVVTSPPYNLGKSYERDQMRHLNEYMGWQKRIIHKISPLLKPGGSICWQVGNYVSNGHILPLDIVLHPYFEKENLILRNRIVWHFGHGLHSKKRFSGRYEVVMWYTKTDGYYFDLDAVRIPSKYPGKRAFKGPHLGQLTGNPKGKNPADFWESPDGCEDEPNDVWDIPNVKANHVEKTEHPCQFPVGLVEPLIMALCPVHGLVFDPFAGVGSSGVAALLHDRRYLGAELCTEYVELSHQRLTDALRGEAHYRPWNKPVYDASLSPLSRKPER